MHFWKNIIHNLKRYGHEVKIVAWDKDVTLYLLNAYGFKYTIIGRSYKSFFGKAYDMFKSDFKVFIVAKKFKPDLFIHGDPYLAHVSKITGKKHIEYCDTDHAHFIHLTTFPFSDVICTPTCFLKKINSRKHIAFDGYSELAYLHPNYFKPDSSVLNKLGLNINDKFIIMRFVAWGASHDVNQQGFTNKKILVEELEKYGRIFIFSENKLPNEFLKYQINMPPESFHHLLYYATMYIGEGATIAAEAAMLGTPALYVNTLQLGYLNELEKKYELVYNFSDQINGQKEALEKAIHLLKNENLKKEWLQKKDQMLKESVDVTNFMTELINTNLNNRKS